MKIRADYLGLQDTLNGQPIILVNCIREFGVSTEAYDYEKHIISQKDLIKIKRDLVNYNKDEKFDMVKYAEQLFMGEL